MSNHFKLFFPVLFLLFSAATVSAQIRFGAKAGFNVAKVNYRVHSRLEPKMNPSYQVGGLVEFPFLGNTYINVGLEAQGKGYKYVTDSTAYKLSGKVAPLYIQIPVDLVVRGYDGGVYASIGTYFAYGIAGNVEKVTETKPGGDQTTVTDGVVFENSDQAHFKPFDVGATLQFGYETQGGIRIWGAYSWGFGDTRGDAIKVTEFITPVNHRVGSIGFSYIFKTLK